MRAASFSLRHAVPGIVSGFERSLLLRAPILWRSRLLRILVVAPLGWLIASFAASVFPARPSTVWPQSNIDIADYVAWGYALLTCIFWSRVQLRYPIGVQGLRTHLKVALFNMFGLLLLLSPAALFHGIVSARIAGAMPRDELMSEMKFHKNFGHWMCKSGGGQEEAPLAPEVVTSLRLSAKKFGFDVVDEPMSVNNNEWEAVCGDDAVWRYAGSISILDPKKEDARGLLWARLQTLELHGRAGSGDLSHILRATANQFAVLVGLTAIGVAGLGLLSLPASQWRRLVPQRHLPRILPWPRIALPRKIVQLSHRRLLSAPARWAAQGQVLSYRVLACSIPLASLYFAVYPPTGSLFRNSLRLYSDHFALWELAAAVYASLFWIMRFARFRVACKSLRDWYALDGYIATSLVACFIAGFLYLCAILLIFAPFSWEDFQDARLDKFGMQAFCLIIQVIAIARLANWLSKLETALLCTLFITILFALALTRIASTPTWIAGIWVCMAVLLTKVSKVRRPSRPIAWWAGAVVVLEPTAVLVGWVTFTEASRGSFPDAVLNAILIVLYLVTHLILVHPASRVLTRYRYWPARE